MPCYSIILGWPACLAENVLCLYDWANRNSTIEDCQCSIPQYSLCSTLWQSAKTSCMSAGPLQYCGLYYTLNLQLTKNWWSVWFRTYTECQSTDIIHDIIWKGIIVVYLYPWYVKWLGVYYYVMSECYDTVHIYQNFAKIIVKRLVSKQLQTQVAPDVLGIQH